MRTRISFELGAEHLAMLDAMCIAAKKQRAAMAGLLLRAVLEDDAAEHGACGGPPGDNIIIFRRGA